MFNFFVIFFIFFCDFFVFSNLEAFICFFLFLGLCGILTLGLNKFIKEILSIAILKYRDLLTYIYNILIRFEYFDCVSKNIFFSLRNKLN